MSDKKAQPIDAPAKSMVGPLEELYLVAFIAEGEEQTKIETALRKWADKWLINMSYAETIDTTSVSTLTVDEQRAHARKLVQDAKQKLGEALASASATYRETPLQDANTIKSGITPTVHHREYQMFAVRRWEK
jgi:hypothetical protein